MPPIRRSSRLMEAILFLNDDEKYFNAELINYQDARPIDKVSKVVSLWNSMFETIVTTQHPSFLFFRWLRKHASSIFIDSSRVRTSFGAAIFCMQTLLGLSSTDQ